MNLSKDKVKMKLNLEQTFLGRGAAARILRLILGINIQQLIEAGINGRIIRYNPINATCTTPNVSIMLSTICKLA